MIDQEAPLVAALRSDDHAAFAEQVQHHRQALHVHCYRTLGSIDDAEDVVQETLLHAWRQRRRFEGRSSFRAWLYRIATPLCWRTAWTSLRLAHMPPPEPRLRRRSTQPPRFTPLDGTQTPPPGRDPLLSTASSIRAAVEAALLTNPVRHPAHAEASKLLTPQPGPFPTPNVGGESRVAPSTLTLQPPGPLAASPR